MRPVRVASLALSASILVAAACGSDQTTPPNYGYPPDASGFNPGTGGGGGGYGYGYGGGPTTGDAGLPRVDATVGPACAVSMQLCPEVFTYPYAGESSVSVMGSYSA